MAEAEIADGKAVGKQLKWLVAALLIFAASVGIRQWRHRNSLPTQEQVEALVQEELKAMEDLGLLLKRVADEKAQDKYGQEVLHAADRLAWIIKRRLEMPSELVTAEMEKVKEQRNKMLNLLNHAQAYILGGMPTDGRAFLVQVRMAMERHLGSVPRAEVFQFSGGASGGAGPAETIGSDSGEAKSAE